MQKIHLHYTTHSKFNYKKSLCGRVLLRKDRNSFTEDTEEITCASCIIALHFKKRKMMDLLLNQGNRI